MILFEKRQKKIKEKNCLIAFGKTWWTNSRYVYKEDVYKWRNISLRK